MQQNPRKIVIIGPESTGKSFLSARLAAYYNTSWVPEYARDYLNKTGPEYNYADLLTIAKGQIELEDSIHESLLKSENFEKNASESDISYLFIDTDMYVMKVWAEYVFNDCHTWILDQISSRKYDGYLLCNVDLPWEKDQLREYPDLATRERLYHYYKDCLVQQSVPWCDISGNYDERFEKATAFVEDINL